MSKKITKKPVPSRVATPVYMDKDVKAILVEIANRQKPRSSVSALCEMVLSEFARENANA